MIGELPAPESGDTAAAEGRITRWREDTREQRMKIADEAQAKYGRNVAWGARIGETGRLFTHLAVPAMTRLRFERRCSDPPWTRCGVFRAPPVRPPGREPPVSSAAWRAASGS